MKPRFPVAFALALLTLIPIAACADTVKVPGADGGEYGGFHIAGWSANSAGVFEIVMAYPGEFLSVTGIAGMPGRGRVSRAR